MAPGTERPDAAFVRQAMVGSRFSHVRWIDETGSTNTDLLLAAERGEGEQALIADLQTTGRGRRGRTWQAPAGSSVLMSILVREVRASEAFWTVGAVSLAAVDAIGRVAGVACTIKWPNDLLVADAKVAGVLAQVVDDATVIGIGINVNWPEGVADQISLMPGARPATALIDHRPGREPIDRVALVIAILEGVSSWLETDLRSRRQAWKQHCSTIGARVRLDLGAGGVIGEAVDIAESGALTIETNGVRTVHEVGDVVHLRQVDDRGD
jgi:BirA family biotin operon repressor/biotin-[acetyl-CoA-carboxylase] ligase